MRGKVLGNSVASTFSDAPGPIAPGGRENMNLLRAAAEIARFLEDQGIPYFIIGGLALRWSLNSMKITNDLSANNWEV